MNGNTETVAVLIETLRRAEWALAVALKQDRVGWVHEQVLVKIREVLDTYAPETAP